MPRLAKLAAGALMDECQVAQIRGVVAAVPWRGNPHIPSFCVHIAAYARSRPRVRCRS